MKKSMIAYILGESGNSPRQKRQGRLNNDKEPLNVTYGLKVRSLDLLFGGQKETDGSGNARHLRRRHDQVVIKRSF